MGRAKALSLHTALAAHWEFALLSFGHQGGIFQMKLSLGICVPAHRSLHLASSLSFQAKISFISSESGAVHESIWHFFLRVSTHPDWQSCGSVFSLLPSLSSPVLQQGDPTPSVSSSPLTPELFRVSLNASNLLGNSWCFLIFLRMFSRDGTELIYSVKTQ